MKAEVIIEKHCSNCYGHIETCDECQHLFDRTEDIHCCHIINELDDHIYHYCVECV